MIPQKMSQLSARELIELEQCEYVQQLRAKLNELQNENKRLMACLESPITLENLELAVDWDIDRRVRLTRTSAGLGAWP